MRLQSVDTSTNLERSCCVLVLAAFRRPELGKGIGAALRSLDRAHGLARIVPLPLRLKATTRADC